MKAAVDISHKAGPTRESANRVSQQPLTQAASLGSPRTAALDFEDQRPDAIVQRKLQESTNSSHRVIQTARLQEMVNNGPQARRSAQTQAMLNSQPSRVPSSLSPFSLAPSQPPATVPHQQVTVPGQGTVQRASSGEGDHPAEILRQARVVPGSVSAVHGLQRAPTRGVEPTAEGASSLAARRLALSSQRKGAEAASDRRTNRTGIPMPLLRSMEGLLGHDFSHVRVHPNSPKAPEVGALAYTQGRDVYVAPGQYAPETAKGNRLLGHELTHVVQQAQGRVSATTQVRGVAINDDPALEHEADVVGENAAGWKTVTGTGRVLRRSTRRREEPRSRAAPSESVRLPIQRVPADFQGLHALVIPAGFSLLGTPWTRVKRRIRRYIALPPVNVLARLQALQRLDAATQAWEAHHNVAAGNLSDDEQRKVAAITQVQVFINRERTEMGVAPGLTDADVAALFPLIASHGQLFRDQMAQAVVNQGLPANRMAALATAVAALPAADVLSLMDLHPTHTDAQLQTLGQGVAAGLPAARVRILAVVVNNLPAADVVTLAALHATHTDTQLIALGAGVPGVAAGFAGGRNAAAIVTMAHRVPAARAADVIAFMGHAGPVTGHKTPQDNFAGRSANLGIAEIADLVVAIVPAALTAAEIGNVAWAVAIGGGALGGVNPATGQAVYTADGTVGATRLTASIVNAPYAGVEVSRLDFQVLAPNDALMQQDAQPVRHTHNTWSVGFYGEAWLRPTTVSFNRIEWSEGIVNAGATGFLALFDNIVHPQGLWHNVLNGNAGAGNKVNMIDQVHSGTLAPPYALGDFHWNIPWQYRVAGGTPVVFTHALHHATADATGRATIEKKDAGPFVKDAGDPNS